MAADAARPFWTGSSTCPRNGRRTGRGGAADVPFGWVTGDTVYGNNRKLRGWLEEQGRCYVLAVKNNEPLWPTRNAAQHRWQRGTLLMRYPMTSGNV